MVNVWAGRLGRVVGKGRATWLAAGSLEPKEEGLQRPLELGAVVALVRRRTKDPNYVVTQASLLTRVAALGVHVGRAVGAGDGDGVGHVAQCGWHLYL